MHSAPTWRELNLIGRARLDAEKFAAVSSPGTAIYVSRETLATLFAWPDDASLTGFHRTQEGFAYKGHPIKGTA